MARRKTLNILADGAVHPQRTVSSGSITLDRAASVVHLGLPIESDLQSLPLALQVEAFGQGRVKNLNHVWRACFGIFWYFCRS